MTARKAEITRNTRETQIRAEVNLDGNGEYEIATGIGFLDHMLEQLSRHSLIDMKIAAKGDLHIDAHHTSEDAGIVLGQAVNKALGDRAGIRRYASIELAMDEALTAAAIDISGRPYLVWHVEFPAGKVGEYDTELFQEFFHAFATNARITLHVRNIYGSNSHHIAETCFKAVARVLRHSVEYDARLDGALPSTKGVLGE